MRGIECIRATAQTGKTMAELDIRGVLKQRTVEY